jgi:hypothetical protein
MIFFMPKRSVKSDSLISLVSTVYYIAFGLSQMRIYQKDWIKVQYSHYDSHICPNFAFVKCMLMKFFPGTQKT